MLPSSRTKNTPTKNVPEVIRPRSIKEPGSKPHPPAPAKDRHRKIYPLGILLMVLIVAGGYLFHYLNFRPAMSEPASSLPTTEDQNTVVAADTVDAVPSESVNLETGERISLEKVPIVRQRDRLSQKVTALTKKGAPEWGEPLYSEMVGLAREADTLFSQNDLSTASGRYAAALEKADVLNSKIATVLQKYIEDGQAALSQGSGQTAQKKFQMALLLDPGNAVAQNGLERAAHANAVWRLVESGKTNETDKKYDLALADYEKALALDPEAESAVSGRIRAKAMLEEEEFRRLMSMGLAALADNDIQTARRRLLEASTIRPDDPGVVDALAQTDQAIRLKRIENLRQKALRAEVSEDWQQARDAYLKVLEVDGNIRFADRGLARALDNLRFEKQIDFFIDNPAALENDRQLQHALALLDETEDLKTTGPRLNTRLGQLKALVAAARTPVPLVIESDNLTDVAVFKVGKFGRFTMRELSLRPGTYTAVGSREGYQDIRKTFRVEPGQQLQRISIICRVKV